MRISESALFTLRRSTTTTLHRVFFILAITILLASSAVIYQILSNNLRTALAAPNDLTISSITPNNGPQIGGTQVVIDGSGFMKTVTWKQVVVGNFHSCAIATSGDVYCWGYNEVGQLGNGSTANSGVPVAISQGAIPAGEQIESLALGANHTCAIATNNKVYCWGQNTMSQLGDGTTNDRSVPVELSQGAIPVYAEIQSISSSYNHTCILTTETRIYCWGLNGHGQLGDGSVTNSAVPVLVQNGAMASSAVLRSVSAGYHHTCAVDVNNRAYCWGYNDHGELGDGTSTNSGSPVVVAQGDTPSANSTKVIVAGYHATCSIATNDRAYCWGYNAMGQSGNGTTTHMNSPSAVLQGEIPAGVTIKDIGVGLNYSCAVAMNDRAYCWGWNDLGQLGNGLSTNTTSPVAVSAGEIPVGAVVSGVSVGRAHTCVLSNEDQNYCWGNGPSGQLGNGANISINTPVKVTNSWNQVQSVTIDGAEVSDYSVDSATKISLETPAHAPGPVPVELTYINGLKVTYDSFTYLDVTDPILTVTPSSVTVDYGEGYDVLNGVTATDNTDGNIALTASDASMQITPTTLPGSYTITYTVADSSGNQATATRAITVNALDPAITLPDNSITIAYGSDFDVLDGVSAVDGANAEFELTSDNVSMDINSTTEPGDYVLAYSFTGPYGKTASAVRAVSVIDQDAPVITLISGTNSLSITVQQGEEFDLRAQIQSVVDNLDGVIDIDGVAVSSIPEFNTDTPGEYVVTYSITDLAGNTATASAIITVVAQPDEVIDSVDAVKDELPATGEDYYLLSAGAGGLLLAGAFVIRRQF